MFIKRLTKLHSGSFTRQLSEWAESGILLNLFVLYEILMQVRGE